MEKYSNKVKRKNSQENTKATLKTNEKVTMQVRMLVH